MTSVTAMPNKEYKKRPDDFINYRNELTNFTCETRSNHCTKPCLAPINGNIFCRNYRNVIGIQ